MADATPDLDTLLRHADWVRRLSLQLCADVHAAEDAAQEAWAAALRAPPRHGRNLRGFLARLLRNALHMRARGDRRRRERERTCALPAGATFGEAAADAALRAELHQRLTALVLELPELQRTLVLLHYFDGVDVATLAARLHLTADAVRAQLRRARLALRGQLERGDERTRRGLLLLLAATKEPGAAVPLAAAASTAALTAMTISLKTKLAVAGVAAAAALMIWTELPSPPASTAPVGAAPAPAAPAVATADATAKDPPPADPRERTALPPLPKGPVVRCRLVGLHADAPWSAVVKVDLEGKDEAQDTWLQDPQQLAPDRDGRFEVHLPAWTATCVSLKARFRAEDPFYLDLDVAERAPSLAQSRLAQDGVFELRVQPAAVAAGLVVDVQGAPVPAAKVCAFAMQDGVPRDPELAATSTSAEGTYVLQIPATADVLLVAIAMHEASLSGKRMVGRHGAIAIATVDEAREELLPACVQRSARFGRRDEVPPLVLGASARVDGRVLRPDGSAAAGLSMQLRCDGDAVVGGLAWWRDGSCARQAWANCANDGTFVLAGDPARSAKVRVGSGPDYPTLPPIERAVTPPAHVEITLPGRLLRVRTLIDGAPAQVSLVWGTARSRSVMGSDEHGELTVLLPAEEPWQIRTLEPNCTEFATTIAPQDPLPPVLAIDLRRLPTVPVMVECDDLIRVRQASFGWRPIAPTPGGATQTIDRFRNDGTGPFRFDLPPGRYHLRLEAPMRAEVKDTFLLAVERDVEVPDHGVDLRIPTAHGGRIRIEVVDARGLRVPGTVTFVDPAGQQTVPWFRERGDYANPRGALRSNLASETCENLPPGRYEVVLDLGGRGILRRSVDVKVCEVAELRIELP